MSGGEPVVGEDIMLVLQQRFQKMCTLVVKFDAVGNKGGPLRVCLHLLQELCLCFFVGVGFVRYGLFQRIEGRGKLLGEAVRYGADPAIEMGTYGIIGIEITDGETGSSELQGELAILEAFC